MSNEKFTQGAHVAIPFYQEIDASVKERPGKLIHHPYHHVQCNGEILADCIENLGDAMLYAAAPDMYRALQMCKTLLIDRGYGLCSTAQKIINDTLAKADGEHNENT